MHSESLTVRWCL